MSANQVRVAFIAGTGLSGSTLLEQALSQLDGVLSIGELHWLWKPYWPEMQCECGEQFRSCPFWQPVVVEAYGREHARVRARVDALGEGFLRHSIAPTLRAAEPRYRLRAAFRELAALLAPVYVAAAHVSGAAVVVDASKAPPWGLAARHAPGVDVCVLHLVRDPRAFTYSNGRTRAAPGPPGAVSIPHGAARSYANWVLANVEAGALRRRARSSAVILYDDLAREPRATLELVTRTIGLDADVGRVLRDQTLVVEQAGHTIGGNPRRPRHGSTVITPDDTWRRHRTAADRALAPLVLPLWNHYRRSSAVTGAGVRP